MDDVEVDTYLVKHEDSTDLISNTEKNIFWLRRKKTKRALYRNKLEEMLLYKKQKKYLGELNELQKNSEKPRK